MIIPVFSKIIITMEEKIKKAPEARSDDSSDSVKENKKRMIVVPGEIIISGEDDLPGEGTRRDGEDILASKYGLAEKIGKVIKIIPLSGAFVPRSNNVILGRITDFTHTGWLLDIDYASSAFLSVSEAP